MKLSFWRFLSRKHCLISFSSIHTNQVHWLVSVFCRKTPKWLVFYHILVLLLHIIMMVIHITWDWSSSKDLTWGLVLYWGSLEVHGRRSDQTSGREGTRVTCSDGLSCPPGCGVGCDKMLIFNMKNLSYEE